MTDIYARNAQDRLTLGELDLYHRIMAYRAEEGLDAIPLSAALTTTAGRHVADTRDNIWGGDGLTERRQPAQLERRALFRRPPRPRGDVGGPGPARHRLRKRWLRDHRSRHDHSAGRPRHLEEARRRTTRS